ncbi:MAG: DUF1192 domain-containing protein [Pseudomonadota bacterium]
MDDVEPRAAAAPGLSVDLERLSEDDLVERIAALQAEIDACTAELDRKRAHRNAADALFGGGNASTMS